MGLAGAPKEAAANVWQCRTAVAVILLTALAVVVVLPHSSGSSLLSLSLPRLSDPAVSSAATVASAPAPAPPGIIPPAFSPFTTSGNLTARPAAVLAIGIQSSSKYLAAWRSVFANLSPETRRTFALFVYYHGHDAADQAAATALLTDWASEPDSLVVLASTPATRNNAPDTWTSGRNAIASAMYAYEVVRRRQFGWWGFSDGDMCNMRCEGHDDPKDTNRSATCLAIFANAAMGSPFALVSTLAFGNYRDVTVPPSDRNFLSPGPGYNVDGMFNIMNRRAIPVILPYHEDLDSKSWWGSQVITNWYFASCLFGASAGSSHHVHSLSQTSESAYPRSMIPDAVLEETLRKSHPAFAERFFDARRNASQPIWPPLPFPPPHVIDLSVDKPPAWQESEDFAFCAKVRAPDFAAKIARGLPAAPVGRR